MFINFYYLLRKHKLPVSIQEWMVLMQALKKGLMDSNLNRFYSLSRAILVKDEAYFDLYDQVFLYFFKGSLEPTPLDDQIQEWLKSTPLERFFSKEELEKLKALSLDELHRLFEERLKEQKEAHQGGSRWIGTGGTSPFGHSGYHPTGIRIGGAARNRSAVKIASERRFRNYRHDLTLDTRQIKVALKELRELRRFGPFDELDLTNTIDQSCKNAGDIELVFRASRKNQTKVLLMMDVGGTMDPYAGLVSQLFSATHSSTHFKDFKFYYFHNCVYSKVYKDMERQEAIPTGDLFRHYNPDYKLILIGDAWMSPYELLSANGAIDFWSHESTPGYVWLKRLKEHFTKSIWLNPEKQDYWQSETIAAIRNIFPMFSLTLEGLQDGIERLIS